MEISGLRVAWGQLRNAIVVVYSLVVMATVIPGFTPISNLVVLPYFVLVPGYFVTLLLRHTGTLLDRLFYTVAWSTAILVSVNSIEAITAGSQILPISLVIPALTIVLLAYDHFHRSQNGA